MKSDQIFWGRSKPGIHQPEKLVLSLSVSYRDAKSANVWEHWVAPQSMLNIVNASDYISVLSARTGASDSKQKSIYGTRISDKKSNRC
ncbi:MULTISPECIES: hypothetical protein [unclassified Variovorax]|uniref:hypothetical protein n=1 Tax=unclassified Variovorax TaxID=663243 RepID=UPI0015A5827E|nr:MULTISPECIES: hypothetical protein [unclassified Variovorax]